MVVFTRAAAGDPGGVAGFEWLWPQGRTGAVIHLGPGHGCPGKLQDAHAYMGSKSFLSPVGTFRSPLAH